MVISQFGIDWYIRTPSDVYIDIYIYIYIYIYISRRDDVVEILLQNDADINISNDFIWSPFDRSAGEGLL